MSRIGSLPIQIPDQTNINLEPNTISVKGPKGELNMAFHRLVSIKHTGDQLVVSRKSETKQAKSLHGTTARLIANMIEGTNNGFEKSLELVGTGYRVAKQGDKIVLSLGFSHPIEYQAPGEIEVNIEGNNKITVKGISKQSVGQVAATIRSFRPPEPYKGKGIRYQGEVVRRKAGKAAKAAA